MAEKKSFSKTKKNWIFNDAVFRNILIILILSRIFIFFVGYAGINFLPEGPAYNHDISKSSFLNSWSQYDAAAYIDIAEKGYNQEYMNGAGNYNWFPFYSVVIKAFGFIGYPLAAFLISNICLLFAVYFLYLLLKKEFDRSLAFKTIFYMLIFPTTYFFSAMYTESLFLLLMVLCFYFANKRSWLAVGIVGFCASLTRPQGVFIYIPMLYQYLAQKGVFIGWKINRKFRMKDVLKKFDAGFFYLLLIPFGLVCLFAYFYFSFGNPLKFLEIPLFNRHIAVPFTAVFYEISRLTSLSLPSLLYMIFDLGIVFLFGILTVFSLKYLNPKYSLFLLVNYLIPLSSNRLEAESRYFLILFPAFLVLAMLQKKRKWLQILVSIGIVASILLLIALTLWHTHGGIVF